MTASQASRRWDKDGPPTEPLAKGKMRRMDQEWSKCGSVQREQIYILINKSTIHGIGGSFCAGKVQNGRKKKNNKNLMQTLKENWASWNGVKVLGERWEVNILSWRVDEVVFPTSKEKMFLWKTMSDDRLLPIKMRGMTKDGRWDKQMRKKKIMHFCNFVYQHEYFAWLSFLQALSWRQGC